MTSVRSLVFPREILGETLWIVGGRLALGVAGFLVVRSLTFTLAAETYANLLLLIGVVALVGGVVVAPLSNAVNRYYYEMERQGRRHQLLATAWSGLGVMTLAGIPVALLLTPVLGVPVSIWLDAPPLAVLFIAAIIVRFAHPLLVIGRHRRDYAVLVVVDAVAAPLTIVLLSVHGALDWNTVVVGYAVGSLISLVITLLCLGRIDELPGKESWGTASKQLFRMLLVFGWPTACSALGAWVLSISARYLLNSLIENKDVVAYYAVACQAGNFLPQLVGTGYVILVQPHIMRSYIPEENEIPRLELWLGLFIWAAVPVFMVSLLFPKELILLLAPEPYTVASTVVPFASIALLLYSFEQVIATCYHMKNRLLMSVSLSLLAGGLNLGMSLVLIPRLGFMGAAVSMVVAYAFEFILAVGYSRRLVYWKFPWKWLALAVFPALMSILFTQLLRSRVMFAGPSLFWVLSLMAELVTSYVGLLALCVLVLRKHFDFSTSISLRPQTPAITS